MSDSVISATERSLRAIQTELADMRDDRAVMVAILNRLEVGQNSYQSELRALRSQFDRFRVETREGLARIEERLAGGTG
jgi:DNA-binding transcriptional regulator YbjK